MAYSHAVLGESLELCRQAAEWGRDDQKRLQKNEQARVKVTAIIDELKKKKRDEKVSI